MHVRVPRFVLHAIGVSTVCLGLTVPVSQAIASAPRVKEATPNAIPQGDIVVSTPITASFDVTLTSKNAASESSFIASLYNTASPNYHHFLTPETFAARFGASDTTLANVENYFSQFGVHVSSLSTSRLTLTLTGLTSSIGRALDAHLATVRLASGVLSAQLTSPATMPASIAPDVRAISGISSVAPQSTHLKFAHASYGNPSASNCSSAGLSTTNSPNTLGSSAGYTVQQQAQIYNLANYWTKGDTGVGQTVAIYELAPYDPADVSAYFSCYQLSPTMSIIPVDGGAGTNYSSSFEGGGPIEASMDVEELGALLPGANFQVYETLDTGTGPTDEYQKIADDNTASVVSTSWGSCELDPTGDPAAELPIFEQMAAQGQTVLSAAGDGGSTDCQSNTNVTLNTQNALSVDDPSSQPWVTGVGGLNVSQINPLSQTVWNDGTSNGGGGGGQSILWSRPSWQNSVGIDPTETMRMTPDLSVMAAQESGFVGYITGTTSGTCRGFNSSNCGWQVIGGTSIGAPIVSALVATAAQSCGGSRLGFINPTLYENQSSAFIDVTTGSNDLNGGSNYQAGVGYDMASGLGSPSANFIADLCPPKYSQANSSFLSDKAAKTDTQGADVSANLYDVNNLPIANALVTVTASASSGTLAIDNDDASSVSSGQASYIVTTDANGNATFNVTSSSSGNVKITVTYQGATIYSTSIPFTPAVAPTTTTTTTMPVKKVPGAPSITKITGLSGAIIMSIAASSKPYMGTISSYQYSLDGGKTWVSLPTSFSGIAKISGLLRKHTYTVIVRVQSSTGPSPVSPARTVVTK